MGFRLDRVVPWGRSFDEYCRMFDLTADDLRGPILGCGDGPASFNAGIARRGGRAVSVDPAYLLGREAMQQRIRETIPEVLEQTRLNRDEFVWEGPIGSVKELGRMRMEAMQDFLGDYEQGRCEGRYVPGALPQLPFKSRAFSLALCSHFLFLYSDHYSLDFHCRALDELCRTAAEVRIFPLVRLGSVPSPHVQAVREHAAARGLIAAVVQVPYEFQRGGNEMLHITRPA